MKTFVWLAALFLTISQAQAENYQQVKDGPVHEAFIVQEFGTIISETVPNPPPAPITELIPQHQDPQAIWIPGYWGWSRQHGTYLWVTGVWRRPPPGLQWNAGYWKVFPQGWVWIRGFWSKESTDNLAYSAYPPPDPIDDQVPPPPPSADNYFWVPGYWQLDQQQNQFVWNAGRWDLIEAHWVYFPAQYVWREKGYLFLPAYWDWPVDFRGKAYAAIQVDPNIAEALVYEPKEGLQELFIMELYYPQWPSYKCLYRYHFFFHRDVWTAWGAIPPWWNWPSWWSFAWPDQWWLWWWWCNPGYPNPPWLDAALAAMITPPPDFLVKLMETVQPPPNVTPTGVTGTEKLIKALSSISGKNFPILPSDPKQIVQIQEVAKPKRSKSPYLRPGADRTAPGQGPPKPFFGPQLSDLRAPPSRVILPSRPSITDYNALEPTNNPPPPVQQKPPPKPTLPIQKIRTVRGPNSTKEPMPLYPPQILPQQPLSSSQILSQQPFYSPQILSQQPPYPYQITPQQQQPFYHTPPQGYTPTYTYPQQSLQSQHQGHFMGTPQPQINPAGPKVHQVPGDNSTLPGL